MNEGFRTGKVHLSEVGRLDWVELLGWDHRYRAGGLWRVLFGFLVQDHELSCDVVLGGLGAAGCGSQDGRGFFHFWFKF